MNIVTIKIYQRQNHSVHVSVNIYIFIIQSVLQVSYDLQLF